MDELFFGKFIGQKMNKDKYNNQQLYIGVDGGGTKCRAVLYSEQDGVLGDAISGPANALRGIAKAQQHIVEATDKALAQVGLPPEFKSQIIAGIGLAGLNLESCMVEMQQWQSPFKQTFYTTDLHIACIGAHQGKDGAVMIIGTGSSALVSENNQLVELGGHGFPVGDAGSGAWIGFKSIELTLKVMDGLLDGTKFTDEIAKVYQVATATDLAQTVSHFSPADFAKLAPIIVQFAKDNDPYALDIMQSGARYLSKLATKLLAGRNINLSLIGGLSPLISDYMEPAVVAQLKAPEQPPEIGAVLYAQQQANAQ